MQCAADKWQLKNKVQYLIIILHLVSHVIDTAFSAYCT